MCCGSKRSGTRRGKSGKITRSRKQPKTNTSNEHPKNRERLLIPPVNGHEDKTRDLGSTQIQGS
jgi:hypothetical protein